MIEATNVSKFYGALKAVDRLSFRVAQGAVVGFLGPNGAGKTTMLRMLSGFLGLSEGRILIGGVDVAVETRRVQTKLGYMAESCPAYTELRVMEYLRFRAELKGIAPRRSQVAAERAAELAGIRDRSRSLIGHLSKGLRQRLGLADALVSEPDLLILDEPSSGLDPNQIREVRKLIRSLAEQRTVLLSTHLLSEVEVVCDRAVVIHRGQRVAEGSIEELRGLRQSREGVLWFKDEIEFPAELAAHASLVERQPAPSGARFRVALNSAEEGMAPLLQALTPSIEVLEARLLETRLEDVFASLTQDARAEASVVSEEGQ